MSTFVDKIWRKVSKEANEFIDENKLLHLAAENDNQEAMRYLIEKGANVNQRDEEQRTPLMFIKSTEAFDILLQVKGINIFAKDGDGNSFSERLKNDQDFLDADVRSHVEKHFKRHSGSIVLESEFTA